MEISFHLARPLKYSKKEKYCIKNKLHLKLSKKHQNNVIQYYFSDNSCFKNYPPVRLDSIQPQEVVVRLDSIQPQEVVASHTHCDINVQPGSGQVKSWSQPGHGVLEATKGTKGTKGVFSNQYRFCYRKMTFSA